MRNDERREMLNLMACTACLAFCEALVNVTKRWH